MRALEGAPAHAYPPSVGTLATCVQRSISPIAAGGSDGPWLHLRSRGSHPAAQRDPGRADRVWRPGGGGQRARREGLATQGPNGRPCGWASCPCGRCLRTGAWLFVLRKGPLLPRHTQEVNDDWILRRLERWGKRDGMPFVGGLASCGLPRAAVIAAPPMPARSCPCPPPPAISSRTAPAPPCRLGSCARAPARPRQGRHLAPAGGGRSAAAGGGGGRHGGCAGPPPAAPARTPEPQTPASPSASPSASSSQHGRATYVRPQAHPESVPRGHRDRTPRGWGDPGQSGTRPGELAKSPLQPRMSPWVGLCSSARRGAARGAFVALLR